MEKMLRRLLGEEIELVVQTSRGAGTIEVDPAQIEQVIVNLAVNARDAMPEGGTFTLETSCVVLGDAARVPGAEVKPGEYVLLTAGDTGIGMSDETRARIFEPFYTTKETGKGTGLGLSTVFGIVKQSSGHIAVQSTLGAGTTFAIYLPRTEQAAPTSVSRPLNVLSLHGTETILLLEDDEPVRQLARMILTRHGYKVLVAESPGDALLLCEQHQGTIALLLTDVIMPRMSGPQLAERVSSVRPEMKVLYMSGHTLRTVVDRGVLQAGVAFLQKPIIPEPLLRRVREVLDGPTGHHAPEPQART
jgi:CheY-like chemotaxis protein